MERSFSSRLNLFLPSAVTGGVPQGLVLEPPANWGWAKSHTFDIWGKWKIQRLLVEVQLCVKVLLPSPGKATEVFHHNQNVSLWFCESWGSFKGPEILSRGCCVPSIYVRIPPVLPGSGHQTDLQLLQSGYDWPASGVNVRAAATPKLWECWCAYGFISEESAHFRI